MATDTLANALGTTPSLIRGFAEKPDLKGRAEFAQKNLPSVMEERMRAEEDFERQKFGIEQGEIAKAAQAERTLANQSRAEAQRLEAETQPYKEFEIPQIKASDYAQGAGLRLLSTLILGGVGGASGRAQLMAIKEMQDAEDRGQRDRFAAAKLKFDEAEKARKDNNEVIKQRFERMLTLLSKDRNAALVESKMIESAAGNSLITAKLRSGQPKEAYEMFLKAIDANDKANAELLKAQTSFAEKVALKGIPQARAGGGGEGSKATQQRFIVQRSINSLGGVASAVEAIKELPAGTTIGVLSNLQTKDGLVNYLRNTVGRKVSSNEAEMMNTLFTGIGRNLAAIEASGVATGLTVLANQMQSGTYIQEGIDTPEKVAIKLADIRRIATENIRPAIEAGLMAEDQARTAQALVDRIEKAIPFTVVDVIQASRRPGTTTIETQTRRAITDKVKPTFTEEDERRLQELERKQRNAR